MIFLNDIFCTSIQDIIVAYRYEEDRSNWSDVSPAIQLLRKTWPQAKLTLRLPGVKGCEPGKSSVLQQVLFILPMLTLQALWRLSVLLGVGQDWLLRVDSLVGPRLWLLFPGRPQEDDQGQGQAEQHQQQADGQQGVDQQGGAVQAHQHRGTWCQRHHQGGLSCCWGDHSWGTETPLALCS